MNYLRLTLGRPLLEAGSLGFITRLANNNMARTINAETRTSHRKSTELLNRRLSIIGKMIPSREEPEAQETMRASVLEQIRITDRWQRYPWQGFYGSANVVLERPD